MLLIALGIFLGNWLLVPNIFYQKNPYKYTDGFLIGIFAASIYLLLCGIL
jgi:hypothetical protein